MHTLLQIYKKQVESFDELWSGGLKRKYGEGFKLYCNGCSGENEDKVRDFHRTSTLTLLEGIVEECEGMTGKEIHAYLLETADLIRKEQ